MPLTTSKFNPQAGEDIIYENAVHRLRQEDDRSWAFPTSKNRDIRIQWYIKNFERAFRC